MTKSTTRKEKAKSSYNQCITCRRPCSMSGLCMRMWPEFIVDRPKRSGNNSIRGERKTG